MEMRPKRPESSRTRASRPRRAGPGTRAAGRRAITGGRLRSRPSATPCQREPDPAMKLQFPFMQLPIQFDADALAREVLALDESCWRARMGGVAGNSALPLVRPEENTSELQSLMRISYAVFCLKKQIIYKVRLETTM